MVVTQLTRDAEFYTSFVCDASRAQDQTFDDYLSKMARDGTWGDHVTLQAAADAFGCAINLITSYEEEAIVRVTPRPVPSVHINAKVLWLSFWAEVHYNSIEDEGVGASGLDK